MAISKSEVFGREKEAYSVFLLEQRLLVAVKDVTYG